MTDCPYSCQCRDNDTSLCYTCNNKREKPSFYSPRWPYPYYPYWIGDPISPHWSTTTSVTSDGYGGYTQTTTFASPDEANKCANSPSQTCTSYYSCENKTTPE